jgi:hypothetical protein
VTTAARIDLGPFGTSDNWYRACPHADTTQSDGAMPPPRLFQHYARGRFDVLAITDHEKLTVPDSDSPPGLLALPGMKMSVGRSGASQSFHVVGLGIRQMPERPTDGTVQYIVDAIDEDLAPGLRAAGVRPAESVILGDSVTELVMGRVRRLRRRPERRQHRRDAHRPCGGHRRIGGRP